MILLITCIFVVHFLLDDSYGQFPFPTPLDCNYISHEPCLLYGPGTTCGSDGKDYFNRCQLAQAWCLKPWITVIGDGSCAGLGYTRPYPYITTWPPTTTQETSKTATFASTSDPLGVICSSLPDISCPMDIEPLCGSDERTYINRCEFNKEVCQRPDVTVKHVGFC